MKAKLGNIEVEGTVEEIAQYSNLMTAQPVINPTKLPPENENPELQSDKTTKKPKSGIKRPKLTDIEKRREYARNWYHQHKNDKKYPKNINAKDVAIIPWQQILNQPFKVYILKKLSQNKGNGPEGLSSIIIEDLIENYPQLKKFTTPGQIKTEVETMIDLVIEEAD